MEEIRRKLEVLKYPRANAPFQSLLFAGMERYALLEWLFFRLLGDKSTFPQPSSLQGDNAIDRDDETPRIQYLAEIAKFLGITTTVDTEAIQGQGSYDDRTEILRLTVDLLEASTFADNPKWSVDEQARKDVQLIDDIAMGHAQIFTKEFKLFPADVQVPPVYPLPDISEIEKKLTEHSKFLGNLQLKVDDFASKHPYSSDEDNANVVSHVQTHLKSLLETARRFNMIYTKEMAPLTSTMEVPQLHGLGPAASHLLETYNRLWKFLGCMKNVRDSHGSMGGARFGDSDSVESIIRDIESSIDLINHNYGVISASIGRHESSLRLLGRD